MIVNKSSYVNYLLKHPDQGIPAVSMSIGAAFGDRQGSSGDLYEDACTAMEKIKENGGDGCAVY